MKKPSTIPDSADRQTARLLTSLDFEVTQRCNLRCSHCYVRSFSSHQRDRQREMEFSLISRLLQEAASLGCKKVRFTGGEPLTRQDYPDIHAIAHELGLGVHLVTNGTLITEALADLFLLYPPERIAASFYGWDAHSYDRLVACPGAFVQFTTGLGRLTRRRISFRWQFPPTAYLVPHASKLAALAERLGAHGPSFHPWDLTLHSRRDPIAAQAISRQRLSPLEAAKQRLRAPGQWERDCSAISNGQHRFTEHIFACPETDGNRFAVNALGQFQMCLEMRHPKTLYSLGKGSLRCAILEHAARMRELCFDDPAYLQRCAVCLLRPACPLCPACSWMENGSLQRPVQYYCDVMHEQAVLMGLIAEGERSWRLKSLRQPMNTTGLRSLAKALRRLFKREAHSPTAEGSELPFGAEEVGEAHD